MAVPRQFPYIWATWLPRLLTGENSCEWAAWFKAHHQNWTKQPSDFDQAKWLLGHTALVNERISNWQVGGFDVDVEAQNGFQLRGKTATLAGRPDLIVAHDDDALIVDVKTGREQPCHVVQVMIYLYALPRTPSQYRDALPAEEVAYHTHTIQVPRGSPNGLFMENSVP